MSEHAAPISIRNGPAIRSRSLRKFVVTLAATAGLVAGASMLSASANAAPIGAPGAMGAAVDSTNLVQTVQFFWLGHN
jgi:hypothetical protein